VIRWIPGLVVAVALGTLLLADAAAAPPVSGPTPLKTRAPITGIAADGNRVALTTRDRHGVMLWAPTRHRVASFKSVLEDCNCAMSGVALAGARVGWRETAVGMTVTETIVGTATLARPKPVEVAYASGSAFGKYGDAALAPAGDGSLLVFTIERRCAGEGEDGPRCPPGRNPHDVIASAIWRTPARGRCPGDSPARRRCALVAKADGELTVLGVDAGRIAARTDEGVSLLSSTGVYLRDFLIAHVRGAALSGNRLAVRVPGAVEIHDADSGKLVKNLSVPANSRLEDLAGGVVVSAMGRKVILQRIRDGRTATIQTRGIAHAQIERAGLFVAGGHRVTFTPRRDVLRLFAR
jgi:hypothetical protein